MKKNKHSLSNTVAQTKPHSLNPSRQLSPLKSPLSAQTLFSPLGSAKRSYFFPTTQRNKQPVDIDLLSTDFFTTQPNLKNTPRKSNPQLEPLSQTSRIPKSANLKLSIPSSPRYALGSYRSESQILGITPYTLSSRRELEYSKQEAYLNNNPHITKFNSCLNSMGKSAVKNSPFSRETFYYPDQVEMNEEFNQKMEELKKQDVGGLYQIKSKNCLLYY